MYSSMKLTLKLLREEFDALNETERNAQAETYKVGTASKATAEQVTAANETLIGRMNKVNASLQIANNQTIISKIAFLSMQSRHKITLNQ